MDIAAERAYPTPFANSPLLPLLLLSLASQRNAPKTKTTFKQEYDYIIVGAGAAGSTLASRLSEEPCVSILLLEAGTAKPPLLNDIPGIARNFWEFTDLDWHYKTVPLKYTGAALVNRQLYWPSGKSIGGSSILSSDLYDRGNRKNYDDWAAQGAIGWSYKDVFPYFLKLEDNREPEYLQDGYHGSGGPLTVEKPKYDPEIKYPTWEAAQQLGYRFVDPNAATQTGFYDIESTVRNGQRCSTAKAYLVPVENRTNLDIVARAHVKKIMLSNRRATGVQFDFKNSSYEVRARREVIMSAGTMNTPQLLMLSGIGPKEHLNQFKIPVVADLPVGNNFHDQCGTTVLYTVDPRIPTTKQKLDNPDNVLQYINTRSGPLASSDFVNTVAFLGSISPDVDFPAYELYFAELPENFIKNQTGLKPEVYNAVFGPYINDTKAFCASVILQPKSRGTVRLNSTNPYDAPAIDPNFLENPDDIQVIVEGMKTCQKIITAPPMQQVGAKLFETIFPGCEEYMGNEDDYLSCVVRNAVYNFYHPVGTSKMGDPRDPTTVVDPLLRVKGIEGLRVVDASIMPIVPSANIEAPVIMVAEKAADIIKQSIRSPPMYG